LEVYKWFDLIEGFPKTIGDLFLCFFESLTNKMALKVVVMI
jgi:hypothetical protein